MTLSKRLGFIKLNDYKLNFPNFDNFLFGLLYTIKLVFSSRTKCIYGLVELLCERDDVISLAFQNAQDMKDGAMDHPPWERPTNSNVPQQP